MSWRIVCTGKQPQVRHLRIVAAMMGRLVARFPRQITYLCIIEGTSPPPTSAGRQVNSEILSILGPHLRAAAFITERKILAQLLPPVMNTSAFFARGEFPMRYFASLHRGATYVARRCEDTTPESLIAEMDRLRESIDAVTKAST